MTELFIRRPVMTTLVMFAILFFGMAAYFKLPVSNVPNVDYPTIQVSAFMPGASPDTMASTVAMPLEKQFSTIAGLDSMSSVNSQGSSQITMQFSLDRKIDEAALDVQTAISAAGRGLPSDLPAPPIFQKVNPADQPMLIIALNSSSLPLSKVNEYASVYLSQKISTISGVAQVQVFGEQKYAVRIQLNPNLMASRDAGINEVMAAIQRENVNLPTGTLEGRFQTLTVDSQGQLEVADQYKPLIVSSRDGRPLRLDEIATVLDSVENDKMSATHNYTRTIALAVKRQPGTNTIQVAKAVKELLPSIRQKLPASLDMEILYDQSQAIEESINDVKFTLLLAIGMVIFVVYLFLRSFSATLICTLAIPFSLIATFALMFVKGYSLDNLSLMALTLSVGFLVDDAIVMLENVVRHMEMGKTPMQAALEGGKEIGFTIFSITLSLVAVFIPVVFMSGLMGRVLNEFAVTITIAILVSGFVSLSLTPMLCSKILKTGKKLDFEGAGHADFLEYMKKWYRRGLEIVLRHRLSTVIASFVILALTVALFLFLPTGFIPNDDLNFLFGFTMAEQGISNPAMVERQNKIVPIILSDPNVDTTISVVGFFGTGNTGVIIIRLKPRAERSLNADEVLFHLQGKLFSAVPGLLVFLQNPPPISLSGRMTKAAYAYTLQSVDTEELYDAAQRFEERMKSLPALRDVNSDLQIKNPQVSLEIDRDKAQTLGVSARQIEEALFTAYSSRKISSIYATNEQYSVILELDPRFRSDSFAIPLLYIKSLTGKLVPLDAVVKTKPTIGPLQVNHSGQLASVTISFNLNRGFSLGDATDAVNQLGKTLPPAVSGGFEGTASAFKESMASMYILLGLAIVVIYIILGILYESFIHPITILSGLPSAAFGGLLTLALFGMELNLYGMVGIILLIGIVKKNAIMMVDFAIESQRRGKDPLTAIHDGALVRFRPIMMTTIAAIAGAIPIALGLGAGAEARRPLGFIVVGGLLISQVVTLFLTPVIFTYLDRFQQWLNKPSSKENALSPTPAQNQAPIENGAVVT